MHQRDDWGLGGGRRVPTGTHKCIRECMDILYFNCVHAYFYFFFKLVKTCHVLSSVRGAVDTNPNKTQSLPPEAQEVDSRERNIMQHGECWAEGKPGWLQWHHGASLIPPGGKEQWTSWRRGSLSHILKDVQECNGKRRMGRTSEKRAQYN